MQIRSGVIGWWTKRPSKFAVVPVLYGGSGVYVLHEACPGGGKRRGMRQRVTALCIKSMNLHHGPSSQRPSSVPPQAYTVTTAIVHTVQPWPST